MQGVSHSVDLRRSVSLRQIPSSPRAMLPQGQLRDKGKEMPEWEGRAGSGHMRILRSNRSRRWQPVSAAGPVAPA
jgi:hypothetical protein